MTASVTCPEALPGKPNELPVLKFNKEFLAPILSGDKVSTTRRRPLPFKIDGIVRAVFIGEKMTLRLVINDFETKKFKDLDKHDAWLEGYNNLDDLKDTLKRIYHGLKPHSILYIYRFAVVGE